MAHPERARTLVPGQLVSAGQKRWPGIFIGEDVWGDDANMIVRLLAADSESARNVLKQYRIIRQDQDIDSRGDTNFEPRHVIAYVYDAWTNTIPTPLRELHNTALELADEYAEDPVSPGPGVAARQTTILYDPKHRSAKPSRGPLRARETSRTPSPSRPPGRPLSASRGSPVERERSRSPSRAHFSRSPSPVEAQSFRTVPNSARRPWEFNPRGREESFLLNDRAVGTSAALGLRDRADSYRSTRPRSPSPSPGSTPLTGSWQKWDTSRGKKSLWMCLRCNKPFYEQDKEKHVHYTNN